jgi:ubiquinone/menaquinone biosynthesis C-methylase UbiE
MNIYDFLKGWWRFVEWGFTQLYTNFVWAYDAVAWVVSRGQWKEWGRAVLPGIRGSRVLEIGSGPGHLLAQMAAEGYAVSAIDASPQMVRIAQRRLRRRGLRAGLVWGRAQALPWPDGHFDSVVMTFPTDFALQPITLREIWRVLCPGGRVVIVDGARLRDDLYGRVVNLAFRVTQGGGDSLRLVVNLYKEAGFAVTCNVLHWPDSSVTILVGRKTQSKGSAGLSSPH